MTLCIVGGGLAGMAAAYYALKAPRFKRIVLLESAERLGGWIDTVRCKDGVLYEKGPRTVRPAGPQGANTLALVQELGIADLVRPVRYGHPSSTNRMILVKGKLHKLPSSLRSLFVTLPPFSRPLATAALTDIAASKVECSDTSLHEFVSRRLGPELADYAVSSLVRGICAGDSRKVSVHFIARYLHQLEQETGRICLGVARDWVKSWYHHQEPCAEEQLDLVRQARSERWAIWGLENGLETLTETLSDRVIRDGVEIRLGAGVTSIERDGDRLRVLGERGVDLGCDEVIMAAPAFRAAKIVRGLDLAASRLLEEIPFVSVAVVNIEFRGRILDHQGFGFLVPSSQSDPILGCIYDSCTFPQGNRTLLTVMMGGAWYDQVVGDKSQEEVGRLAVEQVRRILGITEAPVRVHSRLLPQCIAQYTVGHLARVQSARDLLRDQDIPLRLVGSSYDGPGINDTIISSKKAVIQH